MGRPPRELSYVSGPASSGLTGSARRWPQNTARTINPYQAGAGWAESAGPAATA